MKTLVITVYLVVIFRAAVCQQASEFNIYLPTHDSLKSLTPSLSSYSRNPGWVIVSYENISFVATGKQTVTQRTILELESMECGALKKHDLNSLQRLWIRDFTLDARQDKVMTSNSSVPRYASLDRMVEVITEFDTTMVSTSGIERYQEIKSNLEVESARQRKFFHLWVKQNGIWKLATKRHD